MGTKKCPACGGSGRDGGGECVGCGGSGEYETPDPDQVDEILKKWK